MLLDFDVAGDSDLEWLDSGHTDVCIVGAGAAGILLATQLADRGFSVLLLEAGGLELEPKSQAIYETELGGLRYRGATEGRFRVYGGTTTRWGGQILELEEFDFCEREGVPGSGWPLRRSDLTNYYARALRFAGLGASERDDAKVWAGLGLSICDLGPEFRMRYSRWCPERDFSVLYREALTYSKQLRVLYHANLVGITLNDSRRRIQSVTVRGYQRRDRKISAETFVLCTGAIEAVRLLLQPLKEGIAPWQGNGHLGSHYQDHVTLNGIPIKNISVQPASSYFGYQNLRGFQYHNKILLSENEQKRAGSLNVAGTIGPFRLYSPDRDAAMVTLREMARGKRERNLSEIARIAHHLPSIFMEVGSRAVFGEGADWAKTMLTVHCEQSPLSDSAITLTEVRDQLGLLKARVTWKISDHEIASIRNYVRRAADVFAARRFARVAPPEGFYDDDSIVIKMSRDSNHHMGGARMSVAESEGIVDANLRIHGVANAYLCSSAVFPTSGFSNPTFTLLALGMRLVDHLSKQTGVATVTEKATDSNANGMRTVRLAKGRPGVPQLGFGCAYLLGPGIDRNKSLRLLETAYDAGIRYFDTARLYGQGRCEALVGEFLRSHPEARVGTKFGLEPPNFLQRGVSSVGRRIGPASGLARVIRGSGKVRFDARTASRSLTRSLKALGREEVDLFLLHEPLRTELVHDDLLAYLMEQQRQGTIGNFGIGGEYTRVAELYATRRAYTRVLQFEHSILSPPVQVPESTRVHYRMFAKPAQILRKHLEEDPKLAWWWSEMVGADLMEPGVLPQLLLRASLDKYPDSLGLFSTSDEQHIYACVKAASDVGMSGPARRLIQLLRAEDSRLGREIYREGV